MNGQNTKPEPYQHTAMMKNQISVPVSLLTFAAFHFSIESAPSKTVLRRELSDTRRAFLNRVALWSFTT